MASPLEAQDLASRFEHDGVAELGQVLGAEDVAAVREHLAVYVREVVPRMPDHIRERLVKHEPGTSVVRRCYNLHQADPYFEALPDRLGLADVVRAFVPWEPRLYCVETFFKAPLVGRPAPLHQEVAFFEQEQFRRIANIWIALDDVTHDSGPVRFFLGTHKAGLLPHHHDETGHLVCDRQAAERAASWARTVVLPSGWATIHDGYTAHDSLPNHSSQPRLALVVGYRHAVPSLDGGPG